MGEQVQSKQSYFKEFIVLWLGQLVATIGHGISSFGIGVFVFKMTNQVTSISLVTLCAYLPTIALAPVAGVLADRYDRRLLMIIGDGISALGLVVLLILYKMSLLQFWHILVCVGFSSVFQALLDPCYRATVTDLVDEKDYSKASGLVQLATSAQYLISPFIAGLIMHSFDVSVVLLIDILTIFVTVLSTGYVRRVIKLSKPRDKTEDFWLDFKDGWRFIAERKGILYLMILISLITFYMGFLVVLVQPMILTISTAQVLGTIQSVAAVGMLISSILIGVISIKYRMVNVLSVGLIIGGILIVGMGLTRQLIVFTVVSFLFYASLPFVNTAVEVLMRRAIPNQTQGRVWGLVGVISQIGYIIAYAISGPLSDYVFIPLLKENGLLANTIVGQIVGVGPNRGIGLMFIIAGVLIIIAASLIPRFKVIRQLDEMST